MASNACMQRGQAKSMTTAIVFDMNGTLLDTEALAGPIRRIFGRKLTADAWFTRVLEHSMATSLAGDYREFGEIAMAVLEMSAAGLGVRLSKSDIGRVKSGMTRLPPFREVKKALGRLQAGGFRLAVLTNSGKESLAEQLRYTRLRKYFEDAFSVDIVRRYKPAPDPYRAAAYLLGVDPYNVLMVAAHHWDLMGAARAGCRTAFLARPGKALFPGAPTPDYVANELNELADRLLGQKGGGKERTNHGLALAGGGVLLGAAGSALVEMLLMKRNG